MKLLTLHNLHPPKDVDTSKDGCPTIVQKLDLLVRIVSEDGLRGLVARRIAADKREPRRRIAKAEAKGRKRGGRRRRTGMVGCE